VLSLVVCWESAATAAAKENTPQGESEASHVERFTNPQTKWQRAEQEASARLAANPKDSHALADRGVARLNLGQIEVAVGDLNQAAELDTTSAGVRAQLAYAFMLLGHQQEALAAAKAALALDPENQAAHAHIGRVLLEGGSDPQQAAAHLKRAVELNPEDSNLRFDLFSAYRQSGDLLHANAELRLLRAILPPTDPRIPYGEGLLETDRGQIPPAIERFQKALQANPRYAAARYDLARALVQTERWKEALDLVGPLSKDYPRSYTAAYLHALVLENSQRNDEAVEEARRAISLEPNSADAYTLLGIALGGRGKSNEALAALETASHLDPRSFDAQFYLGRARHALGDLAGAGDAFRGAVELKPDDVQARFFLATALEELGDAEGAQAQYQELIQRKPQDPRGYVGLGDFQAKHGQLKPAVASLRRARELDPKNVEATLTLGRTLSRMGQVQSAVSLLREAVGMSADSAEAHYQLGLALQRSGRSKEAAQEFAVVDRLNREYRSRSGGMGIPPNPNPRRD
jgi:tetratricopeptide (TPR) repeat protein